MTHSKSSVFVMKPPLSPSALSCEYSDTGRIGSVLMRTFSRALKSMPWQAAELGVDNLSGEFTGKVDAVAMPTFSRILEPMTRRARTSATVGPILFINIGSGFRAPFLWTAATGTLFGFVSPVFITLRFFAGAFSTPFEFSFFLAIRRSARSWRVLILISIEHNQQLLVSSRVFLFSALYAHPLLLQTIELKSINVRHVTEAIDCESVFVW